jgi:mono/diheme cytochrome c family protein
MGSKRHPALSLLLLAAVLPALALVLYLVFRSPPGPPPPPAGPQATPEELKLARGRELYGIYCVACHGDKGEGDGPAGRFLYPKPRNFVAGRFRIVSTANAYPSDADLLGVITGGMPGSAMFPFAHLSAADREALVAQVRQLIRTGTEARLRKTAEERGDTDPDWVAERLEAVTKVGEPLGIPDGLPAGAESVARGAALYRVQCATCHGETGKGDAVQVMRNDDGMVTTARDFTRGIFKGGREPRRLYARIALGMPGSPMPANAQMTAEQRGDLINFILSLSDPAKQEEVEHRRRSITAKRAPAELPADVPAGAWDGAESVPVVVTPLWWRNYAEPGLRVAALHDGKDVAIRLTWSDATKNDRAVAPQEFEDMAAVQLYKGSPEPFLGMGAADKALDVWLWRAGWPARPGEAADVDTAYPNMAVDQYPFERAGDGARPHAAERQDKDYLAAHAAGNQLADPSHALAAGNLEARGFGTLTMRPRASQSVTSRASCQDGRWTVVLRRPLDPGAENGVPLAPGDRVSVAFALWDGAARDRNGQKLVSIWHDLVLEK